MDQSAYRSVLAQARGLVTVATRVPEQVLARVLLQEVAMLVVLAHFGLMRRTQLHHQCPA